MVFIWSLGLMVLDWCWNWGWGRGWDRNLDLAREHSRWDGNTGHEQERSLPGVDSGLGLYTEQVQHRDNWRDVVTMDGMRTIHVPGSPFDLSFLGRRLLVIQGIPEDVALGLVSVSPFFLALTERPSKRLFIVVGRTRRLSFI